MTELSPEHLLSQFKLPQQNLEALSFCTSTRSSAVKTWAESMPATRISHSSVLLYKALPEIGHLKTSADNRLEMLEAVRPYVQQCIQGLAKNFLNQPLILPDGPMKTAVVAQALQKHMTAGYCLVVSQLAAKAKKGASSDGKLELALHRSIAGYGLMLMRGYQLYTTTPANLWRELHTLFLMAEHWQITDIPITDPMHVNTPSSTIFQSYIRSLLLACAGPNQLRQTEVSVCYDAIEDWAYLAKLNSVDDQNPENLFLVNLSADSPPSQKSRFQGNPQDDIRELDISQMILSLKKQQESPDAEKSIIPIARSLNSALLKHLTEAWSVTHKRSFERSPSQNNIEVCVGISNIHFHTSNGMDFDDFLGIETYEEIELGGTDPWASSFGLSQQNDEGEDDGEHPIFSVKISDSSPGGYCLEWRDFIPSQVKAGEVLGLREKGRHRWGLGVIRWVQQELKSTRLGIQLLAPKTVPYGASIEMPSGEQGDYLRVLMLPELKVVNQAATLLTAYAPFQEYTRLILNSHGERFETQLTRRLFSTGSVSQFTFRELEAIKDDEEEREAQEAPSESKWE